MAVFCVEGTADTWWAHWPERNVSLRHFPELQPRQNQLTYA